MEVKSGLGDHILFLSKVGLSKFCYHSENSLCHSEIHCSPMLDPAATIPLATVPYILHPASCILHPASGSLLFFFLFSSCFEILHSRLAEIDIRPYEIDGNQPDFGYDWIDTIIWLPIHAKTTKQAQNAIRSAIGTRTCQLG